MRILHTMLRVGDLDRSLKFYTEVLGMRLLRRTDYPDGKFTLAKVECLGSCGTAPVMQVNDAYHENLTVESIDRILDQLP